MTRTRHNENSQHFNLEDFDDEWGPAPEQPRTGRDEQIEFTGQAI